MAGPGMSTKMPPPKKKNTPARKSGTLEIPRKYQKGTPEIPQMPVLLSSGIFRTLSNATLARRHLSVEFFVQFHFWGGVHLRKENCAFTEAASNPARRQSENAGPRFFGLIFSTLPPISNSVSSNLLSSSLKRHCLKRRLTFSESGGIARASGCKISGRGVFLRYFVVEIPGQP